LRFDEVYSTGAGARKTKPIESQKSVRKCQGLSGNVMVEIIKNAQNKPTAARPASDFGELSRVAGCVFFPQNDETNPNEPNAKTAFCSKIQQMSGFVTPRDYETNPTRSSRVEQMALFPYPAPFFTLSLNRNPQ